MKKLLVVVLGMLLAFGFTATAFAINAEIPSETQAAVAKGTTQVTLGGDIRVRGEYRQNVTDANSDRADSYAAYDQRVRLQLDAQVTPSTSGRIALESGNADNTDVYTWGQSMTVGAVANTANAVGTGTYPRGNSKRGEMRILEAWILHKGTGLLGIPAGMKIGHMPLKLGNGLFFDHTKYGDDAIVLFIDPTKEIHAGLVHVKLAEGNTASAGSATSGNDDTNAYVGVLTYKTKDFGLGFDMTYLDDQNTGVNSNSQISAIGNAGKGTHVWNFGLRGDANISGIGLKADLEIQTGKSKDMASLNTADPANRLVAISHRGWAMLLGVDYKIDPVKLSLDYAYGSGDQDRYGASTTTGGVTTTRVDNKNKTFLTALGADQHYTYVYEYRMTSAAGATGTGLANTWYIKLGADANITKDLSALLNIYYLRASKKVNIMGATETNATTGVTSPKLSKNLGTEVDAKVTYKIDKNLQYWVEGGYLFAGAAYDSGAGTVASPRKGADDAYAVRHGIQLSF